MKATRKILIGAFVAAITLLSSLPANAFFGPFGWMRNGGWGGWDDWYGYPYYGGPYGYGYPYWGDPWGGYGYGYPYGGGWGYPYLATVVVQQPAAQAKEK